MIVLPGGKKGLSCFLALKGGLKFPLQAFLVGARLFVMPADFPKIAFPRKALDFQRLERSRGFLETRNFSVFPGQRFGPSLFFRFEILFFFFQPRDLLRVTPAFFLRTGGLFAGGCNQDLKPPDLSLEPRAFFARLLEFFQKAPVFFLKGFSLMPGLLFGVASFSSASANRLA